MAEATPIPANTPRRVSGPVVPKPLRWYDKLAASIIYGAIRCVAATLRGSLDDQSLLFPPGANQPVIFCVWHNRLALALTTYERFVVKRNSNRRLAAIVSASKDGGIVARILEYFHVEPVRGSSSRRGPQALLELTKCAARGLDLAITPDGPRGPCYRIQEGVVALAQLTGLPVVPVAYELKWKISLRSWDRFQVPLPFGEWRVTFGPPLRAPREMTSEEREAFRLKLEAEMKRITRD